MRDYPRMLTRYRLSGAEENNDALRARALPLLEKKHGLAEGRLASELPRIATIWLADPETKPLDRAIAHVFRGNFAEAEMEAMSAKEKALASSPPLVLEAIKAIQIAMGCALRRNQWNQAAEHFRAALKIPAPKNDPSAWVNLRLMFADALRRRKRYEQVEKILSQVLKTSEESLGPEHSDTVACRISWAMLHFDRGRYVEAENEFRLCLDIQERVLGPEHLNVIEIRNDIGLVLHKQGKPAEAEQTYRETILLAERSLGPEHPTTLCSRSGLGSALGDQKRQAEAYAEHRFVFTARGRVLGLEHPDTLRTRFDLALIFDTQRKYAESEREHRARLAIEERVFHSSDPQIIGTCHQLAVCLGGQKKFAEALPFARRARQGWKEFFGTEHDSFQRARDLCEWLEKSLEKNDGVSEAR